MPRRRATRAAPCQPDHSLMTLLDELGSNSNGTTLSTAGVLSSAAAAAVDGSTLDNIHLPSVGPSQPDDLSSPELQAAQEFDARLRRA